MDMQPFSIVENAGFKRVITALAPQYVMPSRKYFTENMTRIYSQVKEKLQRVIDGQKTFAFTTDMWTSKHTTQSYAGLTCHWISDEFERKMAIMNCYPFYGSHTALNMAASWNEMCGDGPNGWNIDKSRVTLVVSDNAANVVKTFRDLDINRGGCFVHTIQLALKDGLLAQKAVQDSCSVARKVVGHFKHSSSANDRLVEIQKELGLPVHKLIQDVATRWNSTHNMLERLAEQKRAITVFASESTAGAFSLPTVHQWQLIEKILILLRQFAQLTADACRADTSISYVIPAVAATKFFLKSEESAVSTAGVNTMRSELLKALCVRFDSTLDEMNFLLPTSLDPRYKMKYFTRETVTHLKTEIADLCPPPPAPPGTSLESSLEPPAKKQKLEGFWDCFELVATSQHDNHGAAESTAGYIIYESGFLISL